MLGHEPCIHSANKPVAFCDGFINKVPDSLSIKEQRASDFNGGELGESGLWRVCELFYKPFVHYAAPVNQEMAYGGQRINSLHSNNAANN